MKKLAVALLVVMVCGQAYAYEFAEKWDKADTALQVTYLAMTAVDFAQTRWMARQDWEWDGNHYKEFCPLFFNDKPHEDATWLIPAGMVLHTLIALALPPKYEIFGFETYPRRTWQMFWIGLETGAIINNASVGVKVEF